MGDDGNGRAKVGCGKEEEDKEKKPTQAHNVQTSDRHMTSHIEKIDPEKD